MKDRNISEFFNSLLNSEEEKKIIEMILDEKSNEEIIESLICFKGVD